MQNSKQKSSSNLQTAIFAAGCFWGVEYQFSQLPGVINTEVGYIGGKTENPTYNEVCYKKTGHAEAVRIKFDPEVIKFEKLVDFFYSIHDPTTKDRQGVDIGNQYRSGIFYIDYEQKSIAELVTDKISQSKKFPRPIVTEITQASTFYRAEEYHQKYFEKHPNRGCHLPN